MNGAPQCPWHTGKAANSFTIKSGPNQGMTGYGCSQKANPQGPKDKNPTYCGWKLYPGQAGYPVETPTPTPAPSFAPQAVPSAPPAPRSVPAGNSSASDEVRMRIAALEFGARVGGLAGAADALAWLRNPRPVGVGSMPGEFADNSPPGTWDRDAS